MSEIVNGCFTSSLKKNKKKKSIATWQEKEEILKKNLFKWNQVLDLTTREGPPLLELAMKVMGD